MTDHTKEYPDPAIVDWEKKNASEHGTEGHVGYMCGQCARDGPNPIFASEDTIDLWQDRELVWQEECDMLQNAFDDAVSEHFPVHKPVGCLTCPKTPTMPVKPVRRAERALTQLD